MISTSEKETSAGVKEQFPLLSNYRTPCAPIKPTGRTPWNRTWLIYPFRVLKLILAPLYFVTFPIHGCWAYIQSYVLHGSLFHYHRSVYDNRLGIYRIRRNWSWASIGEPDVERYTINSCVDGSPRVRYVESGDTW